MLRLMVDDSDGSCSMGRNSICPGTALDCGSRRLQTDSQLPFRRSIHPRSTRRFLVLLRAASSEPWSFGRPLSHMKVFISFAQRDHNLVHALSGALIEHGLSP